MYACKHKAKRIVSQYCCLAIRRSDAFKPNFSHLHCKIPQTGKSTRQRPMQCRREFSQT